MRRMIADGSDAYALVVDEVDWGERESAEQLVFTDPEECLMFLKRVADDYSEQAALREIYAGWSAREDVFRVVDEELLSELSHLVVAGDIKIVKA